CRQSSYFINSRYTIRASVYGDGYYCSYWDIVYGIFRELPNCYCTRDGFKCLFCNCCSNVRYFLPDRFGNRVLSGIIFVLLSLTNLRETLIRAIPSSLKFGITSGIGLFIAFLGLKMSNIVVANEENLIGLGDLHEPIALLTLVGLFITLIFMIRKVKGALFIGMLVTGVIGYLTGQLNFTQFVSTPPAPVFFDLDISGVFSHGLYT